MGYNGSGFDASVGCYNSKATLLTLSAIPVHLQPAYADLGYGPHSLPETELAAAQVLSLPLYPELQEDEVSAVCAAIRLFERQNGA